LRLAAAFAALLAAAALDCAAAPFVVPLGPDRLVLDSPPGFTDSLSLGSPRLQELAESLTSASNRILLFALSDADLRRFMGGDPPELRRYMIVALPARLGRARLGAREFDALLQETRRDMGGLPPPGAPLPYLDKRPRGRPQLLAELRREPFVLSLLRGTRLPSPKEDEEDAKPRYLFSTTTLALVRGKPLTLQVFTSYDGAADDEWLRRVTRTWVDELQQLNRAP
jgi:hypothetical protein